MTIIREIPLDVFSSESGEWNDYVGVSVNESAIEIGKAKEGLDILNLAWFWPILDGSDFGRVHS